MAFLANLDVSVNFPFFGKFSFFMNYKLYLSAHDKKCAFYVTLNI